MSLTVRLCAAALIAASLAAPVVAQDSLRIDPPVEFEEADTPYDTAIPEYNEDTFETAHAAYLRNSTLQLERPEADPLELPPPSVSSPPNWLRAIWDFLSLLRPLFTLLFYGVIVLVILGVLYFLFGEAARIRFSRDKGKKDTPEDDVLTDFRPEAAVARSLLEEADALARAGKFAEAVHLLLFRSIEDIQTRVETGVPRSLTAREIGSLGYLPGRARSALSPIIAIVERSFFGGRHVDESGWQTARASYEDFAFGEGWT